MCTWYSVRGGSKALMAVNTVLMDYSYHILNIIFFGFLDFHRYGPTKNTPSYKAFESTLY